MGKGGGHSGPPCYASFYQLNFEMNSKLEKWGECVLNLRVVFSNLLEIKLFPIWTLLRAFVVLVVRGGISILKKKIDISCPLFEIVCLALNTHTIISLLPIS